MQYHNLLAEALWKNREKKKMDKIEHSLLLCSMKKVYNVYLTTQWSHDNHMTDLGLVSSHPLPTHDDIEEP